MQTINLQISIVPTAPAPKTVSKSYKLGYELGEIFRQHQRKKKVEKLLQKDWSKDYSDLDYPTVFRRERKNA
jgi:hypothetical protein